MAMMLGEAQGRITLDITDLLAKSGQAQNALSDMDGMAGRTGGGFDRLKQGFLGLGTAMIVPMSLGLRSAADMEQAMANLNATLGGIDNSTLEQLEQDFLDIGSASQYSAIEVAAIGDEIARAGFATDVITDMTQAVVDLSQATGASLTTSVNGVTAAMQIWSPTMVDGTIALTDAARAADIFTVAANASSAEVDDIIAGLRNFGPTAASVGIGFDEASAAIALFTNYGLKAADSGVSLTRALENLQNPTAEAQAIMDQFGITLFDLEGNFVGLPALFGQLHDAFADMTPEARNAALSTLFGAEALDVMTIAVMAGRDPLEAIIGLMEEQGVAAEQSALRMDTLKAQFGELVESVQNVLLSLVSGLIPGLRMAVDAANLVVDVISRIPGPIKTAVGAVLGLAAAFAAVTRAVQGFRAIDMLLGGGTAARAGMFGLGALGPIFIGLAAVIGTAAAAIKFNIFGLGDAFNKFRAVWNSLADSAANNGLSRALIALGQALQTFDIGWLDSFGRALNDVGRGLNAFFDGFWGDQSEEGLKNVEKARDMTGLLIDQIEDAAGADGFRYLLMETNVETGELEEVGEILESHDDPNDASRWWARIKVDGEEYEAWIDKETGAITQIPVEVEIDSKSEKKTRKTIDKIIDGLEGMDKVLKNSRFPILGELSGFALDAARSIDSLQEHFGYFRRLGLDPVEAGLQSIGHVFPRFADQTRALQVRWINLTDSFRQFRAQGLNPVEAGILAIGQAFPSLQTAMTGLYGVVDGLGDAFGAALQGDWSAAFDGLAQAAQSAWVVIGEIAGAVGGLVVDLVDWTINTAAPAVIGWIADNAGDVGRAILTAAGWVWDNIIVPIPSITLTIAGWVIEAVVNLHDMLMAYVRGLIYGNGAAGGGAAAASALPGGGINIGDVAVMIGGWAISQAVDIATAIGDVLTDVAVELRDVAVRIATWGEPVFNEEIDTVIENSLGEITVNVSELGVEISGDAVEILTDAATIAAYISAAVVGLAIVVPAVTVSLPVLLTIGAITGGALIALQIAEWIAGYFERRPDQAVELLVNLNIILGEITDDLPSRSELIEWVLNKIVPGSGTLVVKIPTAIEFITGGGDEEVDVGPIATPDMGGVETAANLFDTAFRNKLFPAMREARVEAAATGESMSALATAFELPAVRLQSLVNIINNQNPFEGMPLMAQNSMLALLLAFDSGLTAVTTTIQAKGMEWGAAISTATTSLGTGAATAFLAVQTSAQTGMANATSAVANGANQMSVALLGRLAGMQAGALVAWGAIANAAQSGGSRMAAAAAAAAATTAQVIQAGMSFATAAVRSNAAQWPAIIAGYAGAMRSAGFSVGAAAGQGVAAGLMSTLGMVQAAASAIISTVAGAMTAAAMIASPSKLTTYYGQMMGMGLVVGMQAMQPRVAAASAAMMQVAQPFTPSTPASYGYGGTTVSAPVRVNAQIHTQGNLSDADKQALAREFAESLRDGIDIVYTSHGATS